MKILMLTRYGRLGASSRVRFLQYLPYLEEAGMQVTVQPLLSDDMLRLRYAQGHYPLVALMGAYWRRCRALMRCTDFDLVWIEKEALSWWPLWLESMLLRRVVYALDYDDAVFLNYAMHRRAWIRRWFGGRLGSLMARAALVIAGNDYLADYARRNAAPRVVVIPTVLDLARYPAPGGAGSELVRTGPPRLVWIGSPATVHYLQLLAAPLRVLAQRTSFVLRIVGGGAIQMPGVPMEVLAWSEESEVETIAACDVGVMPLLDSPWERGKCGYKLIQYMACGLPVVASNVGVNPQIVQSDVNGFIASSDDEWVAALQRLLGDHALRVRLGLAGRQRVERDYCVQQTGPRVAGLLRSAVEGAG